jgi:hypothetical protein
MMLEASICIAKSAGIVFVSNRLISLTLIYNKSNTRPPFQTY